MSTDSDTKPLEAINKVLGNITEKQDAFFKKNQDVINSIRSDTDKIVDRVEEIESRAGSPGKTAPAGTSADRVERWIDRKSGELVPVLAHKDALSALQPNDTGISVGRWLRGVLTGKHADDQTTLARELKQLATAPDASGGYTVPEPLAREFIDALRARMVLSRAGARTVPMTSKTLAMARIDSDASVGWHAENASITPSEPTFGAATLSAKTIVSVCKLSLELSQDSINVEQAITRSLAGAMAVEIDGAGLGNTVANGPSGILSFSGRNQLPGIGALGDYDKFIDGMGALLGANVALEDIGPVVLGTAAWRDLAKLKTGITNDNTPLPKPSVLTMPFLPTTAVEGGSPLTSTAYMADWRDLLFGIRTEITVRVLTEAFFASNLQLAVVVFARVDYQPAREASFVTLEGIEHS